MYVIFTLTLDSCEQVADKRWIDTVVYSEVLSEFRSQTQNNPGGQDFSETIQTNFNNLHPFLKRNMAILPISSRMVFCIEVFCCGLLLNPLLYVKFLYSA